MVVWSSRYWVPNSNLHPLRKASPSADERTTLLLIGDHPYSASGVGNMVRHILDHTGTVYNWIVIAAGARDEDPRPFEQLIPGGGRAIVYPTPDFGSVEQLDYLMSKHPIEGIFLITDPHRYQWLFGIERTVRKQVPIIYLNIWDNIPYPEFNKPVYLSCDGLLAISKQTENINRVVLGKTESQRRIIRYVPHGLSESVYFPIDADSSEADKKALRFMREKIFGNACPKFLFFYNSRNIKRKYTAAALAAYHSFYESLPVDKRKDVGLLLHTDPGDQHGVDLFAHHVQLFGSVRKGNVFYHNQRLEDNHMRYLYNLIDVTVLPSHQEGWGLSITESMLCGKMVIGTVTGGIQDQFRFTDENGEWIKFTEEFPTNHDGRYKEHGRWAVPVFPKLHVLDGTGAVSPYIYEDRIDVADLTSAMRKVYQMPESERFLNGLSGHQWARSAEAGFTAEIMADRIVEGIEATLDNYSPRKSFDIIRF